MEKPWKQFNQLLASPSVSIGRTVRKRVDKRQTKQRAIKRKHVLQVQQDGWDIDDVSDSDTGTRRPENDTSSPAFTPSVAQSLNPADVTFDRRNQSDSEVEHISEDEAYHQRNSSSESADSDDDCLAIHCTKSRMTRLQFADKSKLKRRRITDDLDVSFADGGTTRAVKNHQLETASTRKRFKPLSALNQSIVGEGSKTLNSSVIDTIRCWKSFETSFTELEPSNIEELPSSPESGPSRETTRREMEFSIDELPPSAEGENSITKNSTNSKSFFVTSPTAKSRNKKYPRNTPLGSLAAASSERASRQHLWQHAIVSGTVQPELVVKIDSIERIYGRVMVRFYTTTTEADERMQERIENIIYMDQGDRQLRTIHAGMDVALELDDHITPHKIARNKLIHLGVTKLCPVPLSVK